MRKRPWTLLVVLAFIMAIVAGCGASPASGDGSEVLDRVKESGVLRVGFEGTYPPFNYQNEAGEYVGFDVDISKEIANRLGAEAEFVATEWKGLIGGLQADKFDAIIAQMSITDERKESIDFTDPYVKTGAVLIAREGDDRFSKLEDLAGHTVGVGLGTTFETLARTVDGAEVKAYDSFNEYLQDLVNERLDVIINDQLVSGYAIKTSGQPVQITTGVLSEDNIGIGIKKNNGAMVQEIDRILDEMKSDGTYESIFREWFNAEPALLKN